jgi:hypothetical protein
MSFDDHADAQFRIDGDLWAMADFELFPPGSGDSSAVDDALINSLPGQGKPPAPLLAAPPPPFLESPSPPSSDADEYGAGGRSPVFATRGDVIDRASSVPPPCLPYKPPRRRTQESRDMVSIADMLPGLYLLQDGDDNNSEKMSWRRPSMHSLSSYHSQSPHPSNDPLAQMPSWQTPATDHPLSTVEKAELLERVRRDLAGVDESKIQGSLRAVARPNQDFRRADPANAFRKEKLNGDTVSPKEAFLDYDDVAARSSPAPTSLFATLASPPQSHSYVPQRPSHLHSVSTSGSPPRSTFDRPKNAVPWTVKQELDSGDEKRGLCEQVDFSPSSEEDALIPPRTAPAAQVSLHAPSMIRRALPNEVFDESYFSRRGSSKLDDTSETSSSAGSTSGGITTTITTGQNLSDGPRKAHEMPTSSEAGPSSLGFVPGTDPSVDVYPSPQDSAERSTFFGEDDEESPPISADQSSSEEWHPAPVTRPPAPTSSQGRRKRRLTDEGDAISATSKRARKATPPDDIDWDDEEDEDLGPPKKARGPKKKRARRDDSPRVHAPGTGTIM